MALKRKYETKQNNNYDISVPSYNSLSDSKQAQASRIAKPHNYSFALHFVHLLIKINSSN